MLTFVN